MEYEKLNRLFAELGQKYGIKIPYVFKAGEDVEMYQIIANMLIVLESFVTIRINQCLRNQKLN